MFAVVSLAFIAVLSADGGGTQHLSIASYAVGVVWIVAGLVCTPTCVLACRAALFALPAEPGPLRTALISGMLVTAAMTAITVAVAVYAIALALDASRLAGTANGPFQVLSTSASLIAAVIAMPAAALLAVTSVRRGWHARTRLETGLAGPRTGA